MTSEEEIKMLNSILGWLLCLIQLPLFGSMVGLLGLFTGTMLYATLALAFIMLALIHHVNKLEKKLKPDDLSDLD